MAGCMDGHWLRRTGDRPAVTPEFREALYAVHALVLHRGRVSVKTVEVLVHQYIRETCGPDVAVPSYSTIWRIWREWFGTGGSRAKYARSAARLTAAGQHVVVHRPGQVVALDTTELAVLVRETVFGEPVPVNLTLALDVYSHSIVAFRLTLVSDTSTDVAMLLRDVMMPLPLREDPLGGLLPRGLQGADGAGEVLVLAGRAELGDLGGDGPGVGDRADLPPVGDGGGAGGGQAHGGAGQPPRVGDRGTSHTGPG